MVRYNCRMGGWLVDAHHHGSVAKQPESACQGHRFVKKKRQKQRTGSNRDLMTLECPMNVAEAVRRTGKRCKQYASTIIVIFLWNCHTGHDGGRVERDYRSRRIRLRSLFWVGSRWRDEELRIRLKAVPSRHNVSLLPKSLHHGVFYKRMKAPFSPKLGAFSSSVSSSPFRSSAGASDVSETGARLG
jgi:hypothetical protein